MVPAGNQMVPAGIKMVPAGEHLEQAGFGLVTGPTHLMAPYQQRLDVVEQVSREADRKADVAQANAEKAHIAADEAKEAAASAIDSFKEQMDKLESARKVDSSKMEKGFELLMLQMQQMQVRMQSKTPDLSDDGDSSNGEDDS